MSKEQCNKLIREKLPHLQELSFGCIIRDKTAFSDWNDWWEYAQILWKEVLKNGEERYTQYSIRYEWYCTTELRAVDSLNFEILWHPIQIGDIMKVLGNGWAFSFCPGWYILLKMASNGSYYKYWHWDDNKWTFIVYEDKPFDQQDELFYRFLTFILWNSYTDSTYSFSDQ